jgi:hypothetical protein
MQNREELRQKGTIGVEKQCVARVGKISFSEGGGINIVFGYIDPWTGISTECYFNQRINFPPKGTIFV